MKDNNQKRGGNGTEKPAVHSMLGNFAPTDALGAGGALSLGNFEEPAKKQDKDDNGALPPQG